MSYLEWAREVLDGEIEALKLLRDRLDASFDEAVEMILACNGKVVVTGLGKSGHVGRKISATLASLGTPSFFMHSAEAMHGDSGMTSVGDLLIAISNSGSTREVVAATRVAKRMGLKTIAITAKPESELAKQSDAVLKIIIEREADHLDLAPTSSSTITLALGDALAVAVARARDFTVEDFASFHSGGALGAKTRDTSEKQR